MYLNYKSRNYYIIALENDRMWFTKVLFGAKHSNNFVANFGGSTLALSSFPKFRILWDLGDYDEHERLINET